MIEFKESKFYKLLQDFSLNNDKETFLQMLAEFYNRTESIINKNISQDEIIKELRELYLDFNEKGIDENIVREKVNYFLENNVKIKNILTKLVINTNKIEDNTEKLNINTNNIKNILAKLVINTNKIEDNTEKLNINTNNIENINSQLDKKANIQEVFLKNNGININDLDEETRKTFLEAQGIDVNYVLGKDNVLTDNLGNNVVTGAKLGLGTLRLIGGYTTRGDVFPGLTITTGQFISWISGQPASNDNYFCCLDYIDVTPNTVITFSHGVKGAFYGQANNFIEGIDGNLSDTNVNVFVPSNAYKMRFSSSITNKDDFSVIVENSESTSTYKIPKKLDGKDVELEENFIKTNHLSDSSVTRNKCDNTIVKYKKSRNLFNPTTVTSGFVNWNTGLIQANENYVASDYIEIKPNEVINQSFNTHCCFFTEDKSFIAGNRDTETPEVLIAPSNAKYVRVSFYPYRINEYMIVSGEELGEFEEYGFTVDNIVDGKEVYFPIKPNKLERYEKSRFYGKKVSWYGTSITQGYEWCKLVNEVFKFNATNNGVGGTSICKEDENSSMCTKNRMLGMYSSITDTNTGEVTLSGTPIPSDVEIIFIEGGTNDWARNWLIGIKEFSENPNDQTFAGACHLMFKNMTELFPNAEIIVIGSPFGKMENRTSFSNKYGVLNNQNLQTVEYGDILLDIAGKWGIKGFNMGRVMQVHDNNISTLIPDGLHFNTEKVQKMAADAVISYLLTQN